MPYQESPREADPTPFFDRELEDALDPDPEFDATPAFGDQLELDATPAFGAEIERALNATPRFDDDIALDPTPTFGDEIELELDPTPTFGNEIELDPPSTLDDKIELEPDSELTFVEELDDALDLTPTVDDEAENELNATLRFADDVADDLDEQLDEEPGDELNATLTFDDAESDPAIAPKLASDAPPPSRLKRRPKRRQRPRPDDDTSSPQPATGPRRGPMVAAGVAVALTAIAIVLWPHGTSTDYYLPVPAPTTGNSVTPDPTVDRSSNDTPASVPAGTTGSSPASAVTSSPSIEGSATDATAAGTESSAIERGSRSADSSAGAGPNATDDPNNPAPMNAGAAGTGESFVSDTVMQLIDARLCRNPWADPVEPEPFNFDDADEVRHCESDQLQISVGQFASADDLSRFATTAEKGFSKSDVDPDQVMVLTSADNVVVTAFSPDGDEQSARDWIVSAADATGATSASLTELEAGPAN